MSNTTTKYVYLTYLIIIQVVGPSARVYKEGGEWKTGKRRAKSGPTFRMSVGSSPVTPSKSSPRLAGPVSSPVYVSSKAGVSGPERHQFINSQVVMLLAQSLFPVALVEDEGFARFLQDLEPGYTMLSKPLAQTMLLTKYEEAQVNEALLVLNPNQAGLFWLFCGRGGVESTPPLRSRPSIAQSP